MASLNPNLLDFWFKDGVPAPENFRKARTRVLYGGRASSKSWEFAGMIASIASQYKTRVLCVRRFQNKIRESVYTLISSQIDNFELPGFDVRASDILHANGSEFVFYGIERNTDEIKSFEGADILWIEEAHNLTKEQWQILAPTIRKQGSEIWISFNPKLATDFVYKKFVSDRQPNSIVRLINYPENPFLSDTALAEIEALKADSYEDYEHIYLGVPRESDDSAVIKRSWLLAAIDAHKKVTPKSGIWTGQRTVGYDVADSGDDKNASVCMDGTICIHVDEWSGGEDELRESAARVKSTAERLGANLIGYDSIGVGAGTGSHLNGMGWRRHFKFNAAGKVQQPTKQYGETKIKNEEFFSNLKAQAWWLLADRFRNTYLAVTKGREFPADEMISLSSEIDPKLLDKLIDELAEPKRDFDNAGKVKVESKKDLAKRDVKSPNLADAFVIAASRGLLSRPSMLDVL